MELEILEKQAVDCALNGEWERAVKINLEILKEGTPKASVYNRLGKAYSEISNWEEAIKSFKKALELDPINSVAEKGLENAKNRKSVGTTGIAAHKETLIADPSTSQIIEIHLNNPKIEENYFLVPSKKPLYFLLVRDDGKKIKRLSRSKLNLKPQISPERMDAKIIEIVKDHTVQLKINSPVSAFKSERQQIDPTIQLKRKQIIEEKKEIQKIFEEERSDDAI